MNEKRRPPSLHRGPAPVEPDPRPGYRRIVFHFEHGGEPVSVSVLETDLPGLREFTSQAWSVDRGMYAIDSDDGQSVLINMAKVRTVEIR